ncbi:MAG: hypothetical protein ACI9KE_000967 [Polyangiales bacterium]|jgi:hypothetical protein
MTPKQKPRKLKHLMYLAHLRSVVRFSVLLTLAFSSACEEIPTQEEQAPPSTALAATAETEHAPEGAAPGSHEDWCGGHQVPESLCTRCNPSLIPAFQATGDWCPEHGLPESQCLICNPELVIERPPRLAEGSP